MVNQKLTPKQKRNQAKKEALKFMGKNIRTDETFKKQTKVNRIELANYKKEKTPTRYFYDTPSKQMLKLDIKNQNIKTYNQVFRGWNIGRTPAREIIDAPSVIKKKMVILKDLDYLYENNAKVKLILKITYRFEISDYSIIRKKTIFWDGEQKQYKFFGLVGQNRYYNYNGGNINDLINFLTIYSQNYLQPFGFSNGLRDSIIDEAIQNVEIISDLERGETFSINPANMRMREQKPLNICNLYNDVIELKENDKNCVKAYLEKIYKKISEKSIAKLGNEEGVSSTELNKFSNKYNIKMLIYDILGNIISANYPQKVNKSYKSLVGISYNNHFYPIKNTILNKVSIPKKIKISDNLNNDFDSLLKENVLPSNIKISIENKVNEDNIKEHSRDSCRLRTSEQKINIITFNNKDTQHISNSEYNVCLDILEIFGLKDKITPFTNLKNIMNIIEKPYIIENTNSFFIANYAKGGFNYYNKNADISKKIKTIDHNKFYSNCLCDLEYLISVDIRQSEPVKLNKNPEFIVEHYLYIAKPKKSCLLIPDTNIYSGSHLLLCCEYGVEFDILEELETKRHFNYYKQLINDVYDKLGSTKYKGLIKDMMNIIIGKFEQDIKLNDEMTVEKLCNFQERMTNEGFYYKYNDKYYLKLNKNKIVNKIYNKCPIAIQLKDLGRVKLFQKIQELNISENDLVNIETDSISFIYKKQDLGQLDANNWKGWKEIKKDIAYFEKRKKTDFDVFDGETTFFLSKSDNNNKLYNCYAGSGKSYTIVNKILPSLNNENYIIITPSHNSATQYYKLKLNCKVVQTYKFQQYLPQEENIIIDEVGLCDRDAQDFIYKCFMLGKNIYSLGDFRQLLPIGENKHFNSNNYLNMIYGEIIQVNTNFRNNFKIKYYDSLINHIPNEDLIKKYNGHDYFLIDEIKKYNSKNWKKADIIICITNKSKENYNKLMSEYKKVKMGDIGCKIVCNTNNLRVKGIYNSFDFIIKDVLEEEDENDETKITYILDDETKLNEKELFHNFELGYAITLFKAQGQQYKSFFMPEEDFKYINARSAYTLISRLQEDLTEETIKRNKNELKDKKEVKKEVKKEFVIDFE
jgi:hypothetical protein